MKLLIIGSGGREHALVWKLAQSPELLAAILDCGGKRSATPLLESGLDLSNRVTSSESAVAAALCRHSPKLETQSADVVKARSCVCKTCRCQT